MWLSWNSEFPNSWDPQAPHFSKGKLQPLPSGGIVFPWRWQVRETNASRDSLIFLCSSLSK